MNIFNDDSNFVYLLNAMGQQLLINGIPTQALISNQKDKTIDYKKIKTIIPYNTGDIIKYQDSSWLIISEVSKNNTIYRSRMRKCRELKYNNVTIYGLVESKVFDIETTQYFSLIDNQILITISSKNKINIYDIIYFNKRAYKVIAINDTIENTLILKCEYDSASTHKYTISLNTNSTELEEGTTYQITATAKDKEVIIDNPLFTYVVSNNSICSVDSTGLITAIKAGATSITVKYEDIEAVFSINVTEIIPPPIEDVITYNMTSNSGLWTIPKTSTKTYVASRLINNVEDTSATFTFTLNYNGLPTSAVTLTIFDFRTAKLKGNVDVGTVILRATDTISGEYVEKTIQLKNMYGN